MKLIDDWKKKAPKMWSIRLGLVAAVFSGLEGIVPLFQDVIPRGVFASISFVVTVGAIVSRLIAQPELHKDDQ